MPTAKLVSAPAPDQQDPGRSQVRSMAPAPTDVFHPVIGLSIDQARVEIDDAYAHMKEFYNEEPDAVMRLVAGYSARLSEIGGLIRRIEDWHRDWRDLRVREIDPILTELRNQYEIASRRHSVREHDWKVEMGER